jgi:hypothetical protein
MSKPAEKKPEKSGRVWKRTLIRSIIEITILLVLHSVLLRMMAKGNLASMIFTGGADVPLLTLLTVILFFIVRLLVTLGLPGIILAKAGLIVWDYVAEEKRHMQV